MDKKLDITASIVLFNENNHELTKAVNSFLSTPLTKKLFLIDNSPTNDIKNQFQHDDIEYIFNNANLGFSKAHNVVLNKIEKTSGFHLVLNPDVEFNPDVIPKLIIELQSNEEVAMIAPKTIFPDRKLQYTCRKYPSFYELIFRKLGWFKKYTQRKEYRDKNLDETFYPDFIHGCFMLFRTDDFVKMGGFDERYFLYMEDVDICRKIDQIGDKRKLYYPEVEITHILKKGSSKNPKLFFIHLTSSIKYFLKWNLIKWISIKSIFANINFR